MALVMLRLVLLLLAGDVAEPSGRAGRMALVMLRLVLLLLAGDVAVSSDSFDSQDYHHSQDPHHAHDPHDPHHAHVVHTSELRTPNCDHYDYPACPRHLSPVCGSDLNTYGNECTLCMKIREDGNPLKIIKDSPC